MSRKVLGVDIRATTVCAVLVKSSLRETRIAAAMTVPIQPESEDGTGGLRAALEAVAASIDLQDADCTVSIPAMSFFCRNLQVPFANPKKIRMVLPFEIEPSLPFQAEDLVMDFSVTAAGALPGQAEVLAAAVERSRLASVLEALAGVRIDPERITLSGFSAALWSGRSSGPDDSVLCVEVSDTFAALFIVAGGKVQLIRSFPLPAERAARSRSLLHYVRTTLGATRELGVIAEPPSEAVMTGSGLGTLDLEEFAASLPIAMRTADLRAELRVAAPEPIESNWDPAAMDGALALAMAEIEGLEGLNFHRGQFPGRKILSRYRQPLVRTGVLAAVVTVLLLASLLTQFYLHQRRLNDLDQKISAIFREAFPDTKKVADPYQQMQINLQELKKSAALPGDVLPATRSIDILKSISDAIPEAITVVLDRMTIGPESVLISGTTAGFNAVDEIKGHLERVPAFKKVTISSANTDRTGKEINFQIKVDL